MIYHDDCYQEFLMEVETPKGKQSMRSIRRKTGRYGIDYFQAEPPSVLQFHHGQWRVEPYDNCCVLESQHTISMQTDVAQEIWPELSIDEQQETIIQAIRQNSLNTMETVKRIMESAQ